MAAKPDRMGRYLVRLSDGSTMKLYRQTVEDFSLYAGQELTQERLMVLRKSAGEMSAKMRAIRIVTASNVSTRDLEQRLVHKGEDRAQAKAAVAWMEELKLVDDADTARQIVHHCVARGYGPARARQMLYEKQIPRELWEQVLADYPDQSDQIQQFLRTRLKDVPDEKQIRRTVDALLRRGHSRASIRNALRQVLEEADWESDEENDFF